MNASGDLEEHFIKVPGVARPRRSSTQVVGITLAELEAPFSDGFVSKDHAAHCQHFFDIAKAQREAEIQPNAMANDLGREAMTMVKRSGGADQCSMPDHRFVSHPIQL